MPSKATSEPSPALIAAVSPPPVAGKLIARWSPRARGVARIATLALCTSMILAATAVPAAIAEGLPDNRGYEMVTPPNNQDADVYVPTTLFGQGAEIGNGVPTRLPFQAADNGEAIAYIADPTTGGYGVGGNGFGDQYLARALPSGGWSQTMIEPAGRRGSSYQGFSSSLSLGVLKSVYWEEPEVPPLSSGALGEGYADLYARDSSQGTYQPLFKTHPERTAEEFGSDAFIVTRAQLAPEDENDAFDVYDVRVGARRPVSAPACSGTGCQGVPAPPPTFATPPSATFNGVGNFPPPAEAVKPAANRSPRPNRAPSQSAASVARCVGVGSV